jgi:large subunit ribosomal protein L14
MVQLLSNIKITDNSSAIKARVIKTYNKKASLGEVFIVSIQKNLKGSKIRKGNILKGVMVRSKEKIRSLASTIQWDENAMVLVKEAPKKTE